MFERIRKIRKAQAEGGFTLIELLVVIIILGILAAVVVFAVGGVGDKGQIASCKIDTRTIRTAQEAYSAQSTANGGGGGEYALEVALVPGFLSEISQYHDITNIVSSKGADGIDGNADDNGADTINNNGAGDDLKPSFTIVAAASNPVCGTN